MSIGKETSPSALSGLWRALGLLLRADPWAMSRGAVLSVVVLLMGAALLGLSGWFLTACGAAGLAGIGIAFDVFRPSAGVRFLALGRAAARYGERVLTHDATLRALALLRVDLLRRQAGQGIGGLMRLRGEAALTRITADVDALDGLVLRLVLPAAAGLVTHLAVFAVLSVLLDPAIAGMLAAGYVAGAALVLWRLGRATLAPARRAERASQSLRQRTIALIRGRRDLMVFGRLTAVRDEALSALDDARVAQAGVDRAERAAGAALATIAAVLAALALGMGGALAARGGASPAVAAMGVFVALALAETIAPLRRGIAELGRMADAAARVMDAPDSDPRMAGAGAALPSHAGRGAGVPIVETRGLVTGWPGRGTLDLPDLSLAAGEMLALTGPSGTGKSTVLLTLAGLLDPVAGQVSLLGQPLVAWPENALRRSVALVPQRSAVLSGTVAETLQMAAPEVTEAGMIAALEVVDLWQTLAPRGGLQMLLGEAGGALSGGELRRLVLARALLRQPELLLLDEPTEGLDAETAARVLSQLRAALPKAAILLVLHHHLDHPAIDRRIAAGA